MSDASSSDQPITPPETTSLPAQVEALKKERDKLELERDQAIGRAQSRWKDLQHAQAETRRMQTRNAELESREKAYEGIWLKQRNMIDDAQKALDEAPSAETMDAEKDKLRKEVEEEMQQRLAMETQQLNAEHEQNLQVVHANAVASSKEELEAYVVRVQVSQQAEKAAKQETQMLHEDLQKQRQENDNKDKQVAFLQERLQQQSDRIQELQQQQMQRYTPTRTPTRMAAHGQQIGGGSFL
jgi:chromosome segregation ATPase